MASDAHERLIARRADAASNWLKQLLKADLPADSLELFDYLKDGIILCQAMNAIVPNSVANVTDRKDSYAKFNNINAFLKAAEAFGVAAQFLFKPADLVTGRNRMKTLQTIFMLSYVAEKKQLAIPYLSSTDMKTISKWAVGSVSNVNQVGLDPVNGSTMSLMSAGSMSNFNGLGEQPNSAAPAAVDSPTVDKNVMSKISQTMTPIASKMEHLELLNKTLSLKMSEMMDGLLEAFQQLSNRITKLESTSQTMLTRQDDIDSTQKKILKLLESGVTVPPKPPVSTSTPLNQIRPRAATSSSFDNESEDSLNEDLRKSVKEDRRQRGRSNTNPVPTSASSSKGIDADKLGLRHSSSTESLDDLISMPQAHTAVKRQRWYETEIGSSVDISTLSKMEINRQDAIYELADSEADYVKDLQVVIDVHAKRLRESNLLSERDMTTLFSNLPQILSVNKELCEIFRTKRQATPVVMEIGETFSSLYDYFKVYTTYCSNHLTAGKFLSKLMSSNDDVKRILDYCTNEVPETRHLTLESYLIKPVQRICKYPLLLREIMKNTPPDHVDYANTQLAIEKIESVLTIINDRTQLVDESQRILLLQSRIESSEPLELLHPSRRLYMEGTVMKLVKGQKAKERYYVLFNDQLLMCKPLSFSKNRYQLQKTVPAGMFLVNPILVETSDKSYKHTFQLILVGVEKLEIGCTSEDEKAQWVKYLEMASMESIKKAQSKGGLSREGSTGSDVNFNVTAPSPVPDRTNALSTNIAAIDLANGTRPPSTGKALKLLGIEEKIDDKSLGLGRKATLGLNKPDTIFDSVSNSRKRRGSVDLSQLSKSTLPDPESVDNNVEEVFVTDREYTANGEYELSFSADQQVLVTNRSRDDYWKVNMKDVCGWVYPPHLRPVEDLPNKFMAVEKLKKIPNHLVLTCQSQMEKKKNRNSSFTLSRRKDSKPSEVRSALISLSSPAAISSFVPVVQPTTPSASSVLNANSASGDSLSIKTPKPRVVSKEGIPAAGRFWRRVTNSDDSVYYYCPESYETCLTIPKDSDFEGPFYSWYQEPVPDWPGWVEIDNNGLVYYHNKDTNETSWSLLSDDRDVF